MTYGGRNTIVALFTNLGVMGFFSWRLWLLHQDGALDGPEGLAVWAKNALWIIPASVVATILLSIVFNVLFAVVTREEKPSFVVDERDEAFRIKALMATIVVASAGFILALVALAVGREALVAFNIILAAFALGDLSGSLVKLYLYRRGY